MCSGLTRGSAPSGACGRGGGRPVIRKARACFEFSGVSSVVPAGPALGKAAGRAAGRGRPRQERTEAPMSSPGAASLPLQSSGTQGTKKAQRRTSAGLFLPATKEAALTKKSLRLKIKAEQVYPAITFKSLVKNKKPTTPAPSVQPHAVGTHL